MTSWNGEDRRKKSEDRDILIRIDANIESYLKSFDEHKKEDIERFNKLEASIEKIDKRTGWLEKVAYAFGGVFTFLEMFIKR